jgi:hypothetical protein
MDVPVVEIGTGVPGSGEVKKFIATTKKHRESLNRMTTICPCSYYKNMKVHRGSVVQSHLIRFGFIKDYTVWSFHGEQVDASDGVSSGNSSSSMVVNADHVG